MGRAVFQQHRLHVRPAKRVRVLENQVSMRAAQGVFERCNFNRPLELETYRKSLSKTIYLFLIVVAVILLLGIATRKLI